jgi:hypothetical protein
MRGLRQRQQRLALALAQDIPLVAAARFAGLAGTTPVQLRKSAWQAARSPRVRAAVVALKASAQTTPAAPAAKENDHVHSE